MPYSIEAGFGMNCTIEGNPSAQGSFNFNIHEDLGESGGGGGLAGPAARLGR
jgi:hypothetical protein